MNKLLTVSPKPNYKLELNFDDQSKKNLDIAPYLSKGIAVELLNTQVFNQVKIDDFGGLIWPNGYDICPDTILNLK